VYLRLTVDKYHAQLRPMPLITGQSVHLTGIDLSNLWPDNAQFLIKCEYRARLCSKLSSESLKGGLSSVKNSNRRFQL
jgi:hypothetical protein